MGQDWYQSHLSFVWARCFPSISDTSPKQTIPSKIAVNFVAKMIWSGVCRASSPEATTKLTLVYDPCGWLITTIQKPLQLIRLLPARWSRILGVSQVLGRGLEQFTPPLADDSIGSSLWSSSSYHGVEEEHSEGEEKSGCSNGLLLVIPRAEIDSFHFNLRTSRLLPAAR